MTCSQTTFWAIYILLSIFRLSLKGPASRRMDELGRILNTVPLITCFSSLEVPWTLHVEFQTSRTHLSIICLFHFFLLSKKLGFDGSSNIFSLLFLSGCKGPALGLILGHLHFFGFPSLSYFLSTFWFSQGPWPSFIQWTRPLSFKELGLLHSRN